MSTSTPDQPVYFERIPWTPYDAEGGDPRPLGRNILHDEQSKAYPFRAVASFGAGARVKVLHPIHIDVLDQGNDGTCTGNAGTEALASDPVFETLAAAVQEILDEQYARALYSDAEDVDGDGPFPPNDNGSSGLSIAKVLKARGLIKEYRHAFGIEETLDALQLYPVLWGTDWLNPGMDAPRDDGTITFSGLSRGGHELLLRGHDPATGMCPGRNSWGKGWGVGGEFQIHRDELAKSLAARGDITVLIPPDGSTPTPAPAPTPGAATFPGLSDAALAHLAALAGRRGMTGADAVGRYLTWRYDR